MPTSVASFLIFFCDSLSADEIKEIISAVEAKAPAPAPQQAQAPTQPTAPQRYQVSLEDDPVKGNANAPVTVVEFSDFQCPFCSRFFTQTLPALQENYIDTGKIKLVYKDLPLDNLHPNARPAHIAAECADEQGKFWEYHDVLFEKQSEWSRLSSTDLSSQLNQYATSMGLNSASFDSCVSSPSMADESILFISNEKCWCSSCAILCCLQKVSINLISHTWR